MQDNKLKYVDNSYNTEDKRFEILCEKNHKTCVIYTKPWTQKHDKCFRCLEEYFELYGCTITSVESKNGNEYFNYTCKNGHSISSTLSKIKNYG